MCRVVYFFSSVIMNGLSLRVSSIKTSQNLKKNSEIQISILKLPDKYLDCTGAYFEEVEAQLCLNEFRDGISIEQQLVAVKKLFTLLENDPSPQLCEHILELLSQIYFIAPLKHPIRNIIARNYDKMTTYRSLLIESMVEAITTNVAKTDNTSSVYELNSMITSLEGCSENFQIGTLSLNRCFDGVFRTLMMSITTFLMEIEKPNSPANLNEILIFLHGSIRLSLWYVQRCVSDRSLKKSNELANLSEFCKNIIDADNVPMDTKLNCGIFLTLHEVIKDNLLALNEHLIEKRNVSVKDTVQTLCYGYGLCNTLASSDIFNEKGSFLIDVIKVLRTIADEHSNEQTMVLGVCRALSQMTKSFLTLNIVLHESEPITKTVSMTDLVPQCLSFVWAYFEHHLDTVRHLSRDIFRNLLKLSHRHDHNYAFIRDTVLSTVMRQEISRNCQYMAVECLCQEMQVECIIELWPQIFEELFDNVEDQKCLSCYQKMMSIHCKEIDVQSWYHIWIRPLLCSSGNNIDLQVKESLVNVAIKAHPMVPSYFLQEKGKLPLELYLFVVSTIRRNGMQLGLSFVPAEDKLICGAKFNNTDEIRIMHLRIFVEVQKTTHPFTSGDLSEILEFLYYNINCQSPAFRQKVISFMTKAFNRIEASYPSIIKDASKKALRSYTEFLTNLKQLCISNICNGANFSRRSISLNLLLQTVAVSLKNNKISSQDLWTTELFEKIVAALSDTYEANKVLAVDVIRLCPRTLVPTSGKFDLNYIKDLVTSVKPTDCVTAAYSLEYCCITGINFDSYLEAIIWCQEILIEGLNVAQSSLLVAARTNPLYGLIFCIRHLFDKVDLKKTYDQSWRDFVKRLIQLCKDLTEVVGPIVNSSSPEGHLPNDFSNVNHFLPNEVTLPDAPPNKVLSSRSRQNDDSEGLMTTPQMLLLCAWRTVKEVSLLLGDLTLNASIVDESNHGLITIEEILDIGFHFHVLLSETKHRGAFEQAFVGFSKLCVRLWRAQEAQLHQLPMIWLKDLLSIISGNEDSLVTNLKFDKICATRRSAGVPFMIQAILTSELQVCTNNGLKYSMVTLIEVCRSGIVAEARTHSLNILRALFRCTDLGDSVGEYISDGIECAIRGYSSDNWPERNSSTLLFSSLVTRVFGVQRTKDSENLNIRNKMTGRIFFLKYPRLFDFFYLELQSASRSIQKDEVPSTLHPLLILLSRLYPSAVDGCTSNLKLSSFLPLIAQCTYSPELGTRKLAVKSIVALVPQYHIYDYVNNVVIQLLQSDEAEIKNSNAVHGNLLQIYHLIKSIDSKLFAKHFDDFISLTKKLLDLNVLSGRNFIIIKVYVDTIIEVFRRIGSQNVAEFKLVTVIRFLSQIVMEQNSTIGFPLAIKSCLVLLSMINVQQIESLMFLENLPQREYEYVDATLNMMLLVLHHDCLDIILDRFECERNELHFVNYVSMQEKCSLKQSIIQSQLLISYLNEIINDETKFYPFCTVKAYTILSELTLNITSEEELIEMIEKRTIDQIDEVKTSIVKYVGNHLAKRFSTMSDENIIRILTKFREMAAADGIDELRCTVSLVISKMTRKWSSIKSILLFSDIVLLLLRDECSDIRETTSQFVQQLRSESSVCEIKPILPSLAEEQYIDWLDKQFHHLDPENACTGWVQLIKMQLQNVYADNEDVVGDEVFDKCEANVFGETVLVCKKIVKKVQQKLSDECENVKETLCLIESNWPDLCDCSDFLRN